MKKRPHNFKDLTGQRFGRLSVVGEGERDKNGRVRWVCKCDCGNEVLCYTNALTLGRTQSCGCLHKEIVVKDLTGQRFGRLTVIERKESYNGKKARWLCKCDCGNYVTVLSTCLISGTTKSCGCLNDEIRHLPTAEKKLTHAQGEPDSKSRLYKIWAKIKTRTESVGSPDYENYGARGIDMCNEWKNSFQSFKAWALGNGYREDLTIDRIDNDKGYSPENCRWADAYTQSNNRRTNHKLTHKGKTQNVSQWAEEMGLKYDTLHNRIKYLGWTVERALTTPVRH